MMRTNLMIALLATTLAGPALAGGGKDNPARGLESLNVPVVSRSDYAFDAVAPDGSLPPAEQYRLDAWFAGLNLGYGDHIYVDGAYADAARSDVARIAGRYGLLVSSGAPVSPGMVAPGGVRVVVSRTVASVPGCPNWHEESQPNLGNHNMSNYGCGVNSNIAAMIADPNDLVWGRQGNVYSDAVTSSRAIQSYRNAKPTGENGLLEINTKKDSK